MDRAGHDEFALNHEKQRIYAQLRMVFDQKLVVRDP